MQRRLRQSPRSLQRGQRKHGACSVSRRGAKEPTGPPWALLPCSEIGVCNRRSGQERKTLRRSRFIPGTSRGVDPQPAVREPGTIHLRLPYVARTSAPRLRAGETMQSPVHMGGGVLPMRRLAGRMHACPGPTVRSCEHIRSDQRGDEADSDEVSFAQHAHSGTSETRTTN